MNETRLRSGYWRGVIEIQGRELPFQMKLEHCDGQPRVTFINGNEHVRVDELHVEGDTVSFSMRVFNTRMDLAFDGEKLAGTLSKVVHDGEVQRMPVTLTPGEAHRFSQTPAAPTVDLSGRWAVTFIDSSGNREPAVGKFRCQGNQVTGTFLTPTGDHRYLAGELNGDRLHLSTWDGYRLFLFEAVVRDDEMQGEFWSGAAAHARWSAKRDDGAALPDRDRLTQVRNPREPFDFTFPDHNGEAVSSQDERFRNRPMIVQLAASWCPNCMDQARFLAQWHERNRERGIEVVALMFEHFHEFEQAAERVRCWRKALELPYPALVAGVSDKRMAARSLPQLNRIVAFPTLLFVASDRQVVRIQAGFNGPVAGQDHDEDVDRFTATADRLVEKA